MNNKPSYGVIVGRFQVHELHDGHLELFRQVRNRHQRVIVLLGCAPTGLTKRNPLDFDVRRRMIQAKFPEFTVVPVQDKKTDDLWSKEVDARIRDIVTYGDVQLYGGRDSFIPYYHGEHRPKELDIQVPDLSGEKVRAILTNTVMESADFRAGIIYALQNMFTRVVPTVDIAICYKSDQEILNQRTQIKSPRVHLLLGRKPGERLFRFIGGHAEPRPQGLGESFSAANYEYDAIREAYEEAKVCANSLEYVGSIQVHDWRWQKEEDKIKTVFYIGWVNSQSAQAGDDIEELMWQWVDCVSEGMIEPEHLPLLRMLKEKLGYL